MMKEGLNNISKYAGAKKIWVKCSLNGTLADLEISDDGVGFNPETTKTGMGLSNMKLRCESLKGTFVLNSSFGKGTRIEFRNMQLNTTKV